MNRILVCGSRHWEERSVVRRILAQAIRRPENTVVVTGGAQGADLIATEIAASMGVAKVEIYPAQWRMHGKAAGPIRNRLMLEPKPDLVIAFTDDLEQSRGTKNMVEQARQRGVPVKVVGLS